MSRPLHRPLALLLVLAAFVLPAVPAHALGASDPAIDVPIGFGRNARGGTTPFVVTSFDSSGPGTLLDALSQPGRLITFARSGTIHLPTKTWVPANTTITGEGVSLVITGRQLMVDGVDNVVIRYLTRSDGIGINDRGIRVINGSTDVWLDHLTISRIPDEGIEVSEGATNVTISWVRIHDQNRGILIGNRTEHDNGADPSHVTVHHTWLDGVKQRQPRAVRWSHVHAFNNVVEGWTATAMSAAQQAQLFSEGNVFIPGTQPAGITTKAGQGKKNPLPGFARSVGDLIMGGTVEMSVNQPADVFTPPYDYTAEPASIDMAAAVRAGAGPGTGLGAGAGAGAGVEAGAGGAMTPAPTSPDLSPALPTPEPTPPPARAYYGRGF